MIRRATGAVLALLLAASPVSAADEARDGARDALRVCADRRNIPFSNDRLEGFENRIAALVADDLGLRLDYAWAPQYRGFLRKTLLSGACDLVIGLSGEFPRVALTRPYYRSSYVFVSPAAAPPPAGFDDPSLTHARIGLHVLGMDGANTPPAMSLAHRSLAANVVGFPVWAAAGEPDPQGRIVEAVAGGEIDLAAAWGPAVGRAAKALGPKIAVTPILSDPALPDAAFVHDVSMGVRAADRDLLERVEAAIDRRRGAIDAILEDFGVPRLDAPGGRTEIVATQGRAP